MLARTRLDVDALNFRARAAALASGQTHGVVTTAGGRDWQPGDILRTRRNHRHLTLTPQRDEAATPTRGRVSWLATVLAMALATVLATAVATAMARTSQLATAPQAHDRQAPAAVPPLLVPGRGMSATGTGSAWWGRAGTGGWWCRTCLAGAA